MAQDKAQTKIGREAQCTSSKAAAASISSSLAARKLARWRLRESCFLCMSLSSPYPQDQVIYSPKPNTNTHPSPQVSEAAVVALPSDKWGEKVAAVIVLDKESAAASTAPSRGGKSKKLWGVMDMRRALKDKLVAYKIPSEMKILEEGLPRNAMGKSELSSSFYPSLLIAFTAGCSFPLSPLC